MNIITAGKVLKMTGWGKKNLHDYTGEFDSFWPCASIAV